MVHQFAWLFHFSSLVVVESQSCSTLGCAASPSLLQKSIRVDSHGQNPKHSTCDCEYSHPAWKTPTRTKGKCIFFDLGANNGDTFEAFKDGRGDLAPNSLAECRRNFEEGKYEAFLVEANPNFDSVLQRLHTASPYVHALNSTAVFKCGGSATFDVQMKADTGGNIWASRLHSADAALEHSSKVTVPRVSLLKLLYENTIPSDHVVVRMDIEGAEWDIVPCLADSSLAAHVDSIYIETHARSWSMTEPDPQSLGNAEDKLLGRGVDVWDWTTKGNFARRARPTKAKIASETEVQVNLPEGI